MEVGVRGTERSISVGARDSVENKPLAVMAH